MTRVVTLWCNDLKEDKDDKQMITYNMVHPRADFQFADIFNHEEIGGKNVLILCVIYIIFTKKNKI